MCKIVSYTVDSRQQKKVPAFLFLTALIPRPTTFSISYVPDRKPGMTCPNCNTPIIKKQRLHFFGNLSSIINIYIYVGDFIVIGMSRYIHTWYKK